MTFEQIEILRRAVEGGMFADLAEAWFADTGPGLLRNENDTRIMREVYDRARTLLGARRFAKRAFFRVIDETLYRSRDETFGPTQENFCWLRFRDEEWKPRIRLDALSYPTTEAE